MRLGVVVEWSKGSRERWERKGGRFVHKIEDRPAPVNYGFLPGVVNPADGEEVDAGVLGPPLGAKSWVEARLLGLLWLADGDHKLVLAPDGGEHQEDEAAPAGLVRTRAPHPARRRRRGAGVARAPQFSLSSRASPGATSTSSTPPATSKASPS